MAEDQDDDNDENIPHYTNLSGWDKFVEYCEENGISLEHSGDWLAWWECFEAGWDAALAYYDRSQDE